MGHTMSEVSWAKELGIDMGELMTEHSYSEGSRFGRGVFARRAAEYWAKDRGLVRVEPEAKPEWYLTKPDGYSWMSVKQVAEKVSVHHSTVYSWIRRGLLPQKQPGEPGMRLSQKEIDALRVLAGKPAKVVTKRTRVKNYVFTEAQMRAAERSLNAGGAV